MKTIDYNNCDCCGKIEDTLKLYWTDYDLEDKQVSQSVYEYDAVCENCLENFIQSK